MIPCEWHKLYAEHGLTGLVVFNHQGSQSHLTSVQEAALVDWVRAILPRNTGTIGAWIAATYAVEYSHAGLIALLHRLKIAYRKPDVVSLKFGHAAAPDKRRRPWDQSCVVTANESPSN